MIFVDISTLEIIQKLTSTLDHYEQASTRMMIFFVCLEMLGQFSDALGEQRDLHLRRTGVRAMRLVVANYLLFNFFCCCHKNSALNSLSLLAVTPALKLPVTAKNIE